MKSHHTEKESIRIKERMRIGNNSIKQKLSHRKGPRIQRIYTEKELHNMK
jgi:phage antirepressor YoqD-like protein